MYCRLPSLMWLLTIFIFSLLCSSLTSLDLRQDLTLYSMLVWNSLCGWCGCGCPQIYANLPASALWVLELWPCWAWKRKGLFFILLCMCVVCTLHECERMGTCVHVCTCRDRKNTTCVLLFCFSLYSFKTESVIGKLVILAELASQWAPGIYLSSAPVLRL